MKVSMNNVDTDVLLYLVVGEDVQVNIPSVVKVSSFNVGTYKDNKGDSHPWGNLTVCDADELKKLASVGLEHDVQELKIKLKGYQDEDLKTYVGKNLDVSDLDLVFTTDFRNNINGLAFRGNLAELKEVK